MLSGVAQRIKREDLAYPMTDNDFRVEQLRRRCEASGWLSVCGFAFSFLYLQFDRSTDSPALLGIYALVVGGVGCLAYKARQYLYRAAQRRKMRIAKTERIFLGGGIS